MFTYVYPAAFALATAYVVALALYVAAGTDRWQRTLRTLPARRLRGLLFGGPFLLALAACGSSDVPPDVDPPDMDPPICASGYTTCADAPPPFNGTEAPEYGVTCADLRTDPKNCGTCGHMCALPAGTPPNLGTLTCEMGQCGCTPRACKSGNTTVCGTVPDGCGGMVDCGADCPIGYSCMGNTCIVT